jgi:hypothetical protein
MSGSPVISIPRAAYGKGGNLVYDDVRSYLMGVFSDEWVWGTKREGLGLNSVWPAELIDEAAR